MSQAMSEARLDPEPGACEWCGARASVREAWPGQTPAVNGTIFPYVWGDG
jgi:hypothetical protein